MEMASRMRSRSFRVGQNPVRCFKDVLRKLRKRYNTIQLCGTATSPIKVAHNVASVEITFKLFVLTVLFKSIPILILFPNPTLNGQLSELPTSNQPLLIVKILTRGFRSPVTWFPALGMNLHS